MPITDRTPTGLLRLASRAPLRLYRTGFGRLLDHRLVHVAHPRAWRRLAPLLGFPGSPDDPQWPDVAARTRAFTFTPSG